jgi:hypothetical protein
MNYTKIQSYPSCYSTQFHTPNNPETLNYHQTQITKDQLNKKKNPDAKTQRNYEKIQNLKRKIRKNLQQENGYRASSSWHQIGVTRQNRMEKMVTEGKNLEEKATRCMCLV